MHPKILKTDENETPNGQARQRGHSKHSQSYTTEIT